MSSAGKTTATYFAIVVSFAPIVSPANVAIDYCSLVGGDIPTRPAPQSISQVANDCAYYYQKSFKYGVVPTNGLAINNGESYGVQTVGTTTSGQGPIIRYPVEMVKTPSITLYAPVSGTGNIYNTSNPSAWTLTAVGASDSKQFTTNGTSSGAGGIGSQIAIAWTADARLGLV